MAKRNVGRAVTLAQNALTNHCDDANLYSGLGEVFHRHHFLKTAVGYYQNAIDIDPKNWLNHCNLAVILDEQGRFVDAVSHYQVAIALNPKEPKAHNNLGCVFAKLGNDDQAIECYKAAIALSPNWAIAHNNLGRSWFNQREYGEAAFAYQRAIQLQPNLVGAHYYLGLLWQQQRNHSEAIKNFRQALSIDPHLNSVHCHLAELYLIQGCVDKALEELRCAIALQPEAIQAYCQVALHRRPQDELDRLNETCAYFLESLQQRNPNKAITHLEQTYQILGSMLLESGEFGQASQAFDRLLLLNPRNLSGLLDSGYCHEKQGRLNAAIITYSRALELYPQSQSTYLRLGHVLTQAKQPDKALQIYKQAIALSSNKSTDSQWSETGQQYQNLQILASQDIESSSIQVAHGGCDSIAQNKTDGLYSTKGDQPAKPCNFYSRPSDFLQGIRLSSQNWSLMTYHQASYMSVIWETDGGSASYSKSPSLKASGHSIDGTEYEGIKAKNTNSAVHSTLQTTSVQKHTEDYILLNQSEESSTQIPPHTQENCGGITCERCMSNLRSEFNPIHLGRGIYQCLFDSHLSFQDFEPFVVTVPEGKLWAAPKMNSWMICQEIAVLTPDGWLLGDVSRSYPWYLPGCEFYRPQSHRFLNHDPLPPVEEISGVVAALSTLSGHIYYHWMIDLLPRLDILQLSGISLKSIDWFVVNSTQSSFQKETLKQLGIPSEKIIQSDRHPYLQASSLVVPSYPGPMDWVLKPTISFLRKHFLLPNSTEQSTYPERIYISRASATHRHVLNEEDVIQFLDGFGFQSITLETMTLYEQMMLFSHAKVIIAPHGSGLTNIIFCNPDTLIVELFAPSYIRSDYWIISHHLQLRHYYIIGKQIEGSFLNRLMYQSKLATDIWLEITALEALIEILELGDVNN